MDNTPLQRRPLAALLQGTLLLLWGVICLLMLLSAVAGLGCVVLGILSLGVDLSGVVQMQLGGEVVRTTTQKVLFTTVGAGMALTGIAFLWLHRRGYIGRALIVFALLVGLFAVIGWWTGSADILSVGG
jgi:hypothetical protein